MENVKSRRVREMSFYFHLIKGVWQIKVIDFENEAECFLRVSTAVKNRFKKKEFVIFISWSIDLQLRLVLTAFNCSDTNTNKDK